MTLDEKLRLDIDDFWRVHNGLEAYMGLGPKETLERLKAHREDAFCEIDSMDGTGKLLCTRDAMEAIYSLAERQVSSLPVPDDYSSEEIAEAIRKNLARIMVEEKADEPVLARLLPLAVAKSRATHVERTYHFPCLLLRPQQIPHFRIGPVDFMTAEEFCKVKAEALDRYVQANRNQEHSSQRLEGFKKHLADSGWIATVVIPPCAQSSAETRAKRSITSAIDLMRLLLGAGYARDMRLRQSAQARASYEEHAVEEDGKLHLVMIRRTPEALVSDDWHIVMQQFQPFWNRAAHLLCTSVAGNRSEIAERMIDGLRWFGEAAFEPAPGTQIVKFVAALERLTTTEQLSTRMFCARIALLSWDNEHTLEQRFWDANTIYDARSRVVHGDMSPASIQFRKHLRLAHDVTRTALFRGLEIHCKLDDSGTMSTLKDLHDFFEAEQATNAVRLDHLFAHFKKVKKHRR
jgi:hypothetical protein